MSNPKSTSPLLNFKETKIKAVEHYFSSWRMSLPQEPVARACRRRTRRTVSGAWWTRQTDTADGDGRRRRHRVSGAWWRRQTDTADGDGRRTRQTAAAQGVGCGGMGDGHGRRQRQTAARGEGRRECHKHDGKQASKNQRQEHRRHKDIRAAGAGE